MERINSKRDSPGKLLMDRLRTGKILPTIGIYDVFSSTLAARHFESIFCSGYGFSASYYGLPDEGFITWTDMLHFVERIRHVLPETHILVDIDDGYGDSNIACNMVKRLERVGASGIVFEDQKRPKKCGHLPMKEILPLPVYLERLKKLLDARKDLFVVARTDASTLEEGLERLEAYAQAGADAVLMDGLSDPSWIKKISESIGDKAFLVVNIMGGGKTPPASLDELSKLGGNLIIYSTPCLFPAQEAIEKSLKKLMDNGGRMDSDFSQVDLLKNNTILKENLEKGLNGR